MWEEECDNEIRSNSVWQYKCNKEGTDSEVKTNTSPD